MTSSVCRTLIGRMRLLDSGDDGSRHFIDMPHVADWTVIGRQVLQWNGAKIINSVALVLQRGSISPSAGTASLSKATAMPLRFFVADPQCPDLILYEVAQHFERLPQDEVE